MEDKKPWKRIGVTKSCKAETVATMTSNAENSPFLKMPLEIRLVINRYAVGDQMIHSFLPMTHIYVYDLAFCGADTSQAYEQSVLGFSVSLNGADRTRLAKSSRSLHEQCSHPTSRVPLPAHYLALLGASRQIYYEASNIFWTTTTFSFNCDYYFSRFIKSLNYVQRNSLTQLHIDIEWVYPGMDGWGTLLRNPHLTDTLRGLKSLQINLAMNINKRSWEALGEKVIEPLYRFRKPALVRVQVVISDREDRFSDALDSRPALWDNVGYTWLEKRALACRYETRLLTGFQGEELDAEVERRLGLEEQQRQALLLAKDPRGHEKEIIDLTEEEIIDLTSEDGLQQEDEADDRDDEIQD
ncbi:MAG: hypothetical protein Q9218_006486 [Villophora microphyllina]